MTLKNTEVKNHFLKSSKQTFFKTFGPEPAGNADVTRKITLRQNDY